MIPLMIPLFFMGYYLLSCVCFYLFGWRVFFFIFFLIALFFILTSLAKKKNIGISTQGNPLGKFFSSFIKGVVFVFIYGVILLALLSIFFLFVAMITGDSIRNLPAEVAKFISVLISLLVNAFIARKLVLNFKKEENASFVGAFLGGIATLVLFLYAFFCLPSYFFWLD